MDPVAALVRILLLPSAIAAAAALLARLASRRGNLVARPILRGALLAIGTAAAFSAALWSLEVRPSLPLASFEDAWHWVFWFAFVGAILGVLGSFGPRSRALRFLLQASVGGALSFLIVRMFGSIAAGEAVLRAAVAGVAAASLWTAIEVGAARDERGSAVLPLVVAMLAAAGTMHRSGGFLHMALAAGALATCVGVTSLLSRFRGGAAVPAAVAPVVALAFAGLLLGAHAHSNFGDVVGFPLATALLLAASATCVALPRRGLALTASVVLALAAALVAARLGTTSNQWGE